MNYTYLLIDLFIILPPLAMSFDKKVAYYRNWGSLFPAIVITGSVFVAWDSWFTTVGVWSFNPDYVVGIYFLELPLEEWLFFLTVPYSCIFILEVLKTYFKISFSKSLVNTSYWSLITLLLVIVIFSQDHLYTLVSFAFAVLTLFALLYKYNATTRGWFLLAYLVGLTPFFLVNGVLTALPVVSYNDLENLSIRIGTIPIEDAVYGLGLLMMNFGLYEFFKSIKNN